MIISTCTVLCVCFNIIILIIIIIIIVIKTVQLLAQLYSISLELSLCWDPVVYSSVSMRTAVDNLIDTGTPPVFDDTGSVRRRSGGGGVGDMEEELEFEMEVIRWSKGEEREGGRERGRGHILYIV